MTISNQKQVAYNDIVLVTLKAKKWGYGNMKYAGNTKSWIVQAACHHISYNHGMVQALLESQVSKWAYKINNKIFDGVYDGSCNLIEANHTG